MLRAPFPLWRNALPALKRFGEIAHLLRTYCVAISPNHSAQSIQEQLLFHAHR
jgi:hypothetical protein